MKVACLGGGPAGLYFGISMKLRDPSHEIVVIERNRADDTFGWGVVLSDETLDNRLRRTPRALLHPGPFGHVTHGTDSRVVCSKTPRRLNDRGRFRIRPQETLPCLPAGEEAWRRDCALNHLFASGRQTMPSEFDLSSPPIGLNRATPYESPTKFPSRNRIGDAQVQFNISARTITKIRKTTPHLPLLPRNRQACSNGPTPISVRNETATIPSRNAPRRPLILMPMASRENEPERKIAICR